MGRILKAAVLDALAGSLLASYAPSAPAASTITAVSTPELALAKAQ